MLIQHSLVTEQEIASIPSGGAKEFGGITFRRLRRGHSEFEQRLWDRLTSIIAGDLWKPQGARMGDVVAFRDPEASLTGEEFERAVAIARQLVAHAAGDALWIAIGKLSRVPGCERLGVEALAQVIAPAIRAKLADLGAG